MKTVTTVSGQEVTITPEMSFVTFSDKTLSGWGVAYNKTSKRIIICDNWHEAERLADALRNAPQREGIRYVNTCSKFPYYSPSKVCISIDLYKDWASGWVMKYTNIPEK
jgi:hypothetical protein